MKKIGVNIKYKIGYQLPWAMLAIAIYITSMFLIFYLLIKFSLINQGEGSFVYRLWFLVIFQFAISMRFKEDFDFLLTLGSSRNEIFQSLMGVGLFFSFLFSGLIILEQIIVDLLNNLFGYHNIIDPFHFLSPYGSDNILIQFVFFFMLSVCCSIFGMLFGSLFYRFGKKFTLAFWLLLSAIPTILIPLFLWIFHQRGQLSTSISAIGEYLRYFDLMSVSWFFFILTIVFGVSTYLNIRRLPQN